MTVGWKSLLADIETAAQSGGNWQNVTLIE
jgi:hypothetical protein